MHARHLEDWVGFFGIQLANALPILGWAQVYGIQADIDIALDSAASRHAVFLSRIMIDLVLIAALIQAISVLTRNRQQKALYRAGHVDRLDPFVERVEFTRAIRATRTKEDGEQFNLKALGSGDLVDFRIYNEDRLRTLFASDADANKQTFIKEIARQRGVVLISPIELAIDIAEGNQNQVDLIKAFSRAQEEDQAGVRKMEPDEIYRILTALRSTTGLAAFKERAVDALVRAAPPHEVVDLLSGLADGPKADKFQYARRYMARAIQRLQGSGTVSDGSGHR